MAELRQIIGDTIQKIDGVVELFYQQKDQEAYGRLEQVLGDMMTTLDAVFSYQAEHDDVSVDEAGLTEVLRTTLAAMEDQDTILMADILKYDVIERFQEVCDQL